LASLTTAPPTTTFARSSKKSWQPRTRLLDEKTSARGDA
jgi:hypothetical protein